MATMDFDIASKGNARVGIFLKKCKDNELNHHDLAKGPSATGETVKLTKISTKQAPDTKLAIKDMSVDKLSRMLFPKGSNVYYWTDGDERLTLSNLHKSDDYKDGKTTFNKGNVAEILFAAAIFLRFKSKGQRVTESQVHAFIKGLDANKIKDKFHVESKNLNPDTRREMKNPVDIIHFEYALSLNNYRAVKDDNLWSAWSKILQGSLTYANSSEVKTWADKFYENGLKNEIWVYSDGETDQKGTKVDVRVTANDHEGKQIKLPLNISLKAGAVKQFGQYGGTKYSVQKKLWKEFFGIDITKLYSEDDFYKLMGSTDHEKDMADALNMSYSKSQEEIWEEVNSKLNIESKPKTNQKSNNIFQLNWKFSMAASILIIIGVSWFFNNQQNIIDNQQLDDLESINIENSSIVETLFIEESQIDEYLSLYVINEVIDE